MQQDVSTRFLANNSPMGATDFLCIEEGAARRRVDAMMQRDAIAKCEWQDKFFATSEDRCRVKGAGVLEARA